MLMMRLHLGLGLQAEARHESSVVIIVGALEFGVDDEDDVDTNTALFVLEDGKDVEAIVGLIDSKGIPDPSLALLTFVSGLLENLCLILAFRTANTPSTLPPTFNMTKAIDTADRSQKHYHYKSCVFRFCSKAPSLLPYRTTGAAASFED